MGTSGQAHAVLTGIFTSMKGICHREGTVTDFPGPCWHREPGASAPGLGRGVFKTLLLPRAANQGLDAKTSPATQRALRFDTFCHGD